MPWFKLLNMSRYSSFIHNLIEIMISHFGNYNKFYYEHEKDNVKYEI